MAQQEIPDYLWFRVVGELLQNSSVGSEPKQALNDWMIAMFKMARSFLFSSKARHGSNLYKFKRLCREKYASGNPDDMLIGKFLHEEIERLQLRPGTKHPTKCILKPVKKDNEFILKEDLLQRRANMTSVMLPLPVDAHTSNEAMQRLAGKVKDRVLQRIKQWLDYEENTTKAVILENWDNLNDESDEGYLRQCRRFMSPVEALCYREVFEIFRHSRDQALAHYVKKKKNEPIAVLSQWLAFGESYDPHFIENDNATIIENCIKGDLWTFPIESNVIALLNARCRGQKYRTDNGQVKEIPSTSLSNYQDKVKNLFKAEHKNRQ